MRTRADAVEAEFAGRRVRLTHLDRPLWPEEGLTKADLIRYYARMAPYLLPHLRDRPLVVTRYPRGARGPSFYQKNCPPHAPAWVQTLPIAHRERTVRYILAREPATLVWLANQAAIELHPWLSRTPHLGRPDRLVVDLDPAPPATFQDAREVAFWVKALLDEMGLFSLPKLSGATGVHIYVPIEPRYPYALTSGFVGALGMLLEREVPRRVTTVRAVKERAGRVYVDHLQNLAGKTLVAPYSPRPLPGAPVSMPVRWEELAGADPSHFRLPGAIQRVREVGDLFAALDRAGQTLEPWLARLGVRPERS